MQTDLQTAIDARHSDQYQIDLMRRRTKMSEMPKKIYAYKSVYGETLNGKRIKTGYHGTGTWIDFDDSATNDPATSYTRTDIAATEVAALREALVVARDALEYQPTVTKVGEIKRGQAIIKIDKILLDTAADS